MSDDPQTLSNEQLNNILCRLLIRETEIRRRFVNSEIGQVTEAFLKEKGEKLFNISIEKLNRFIFIVNEVYEKNRQISNVNKMIRDNTVSTKDFDELNEDVVKGLQDLRKFSQQMIDLKNERYVLEELINYTCENKNINNLSIISEMLMEFWSDSE